MTKGFSRLDTALIGQTGGGILAAAANIVFSQPGSPLNLTRAAVVIVAGVVVGGALGWMAKSPK